MNTRRLYIAGYPSPIGGAGTECVDTIKMFQRHGIEVHLIPTWEHPPTARRAMYDPLGCPTHVVAPPHVGTIPGLAGSPVVSFCNPRFASHIRRFRALDCPTIWLNCMTYLQGPERVAWKEQGVPDLWIYQSNYQRTKLENDARQYGLTADQGHLIRGAFDVSAWEFAPRPHGPGEPFYMGKIARQAPSKWSPYLWSIYSAVPHAKAVIMGLLPDEVRMNLGEMPVHLQGRSYAPEQIPTSAYYPQLHAMAGMNAGDHENWPRVGLEAMATGVPIIAEKRWGWVEMIRDGETGLLGKTADDLAEHAKHLAADEEYRQYIIREAHRALTDELANEPIIWNGWQRVFQAIGRDDLAQAPPHPGPSPIAAAIPLAAAIRDMHERHARVIASMPSLRLDDTPPDDDQWSPSVWE